jgi:hypothetical protein
VHTWPSAYRANLAAYLLDDGSILRAATDDGNGLVERIDKDGSVVWSWTPVEAHLALHHDIEPLPNGHILMIAYDVKTAAEATAAGRNPSLLSTTELWSECVLEVQPTGTTSGTIVWQWHAWDHLVQDYDAGQANYGTVADCPELIDINNVNQTDEDWLHFNAIDYNADLDQILLSSRSLSEIWVIDHSATTAEAATHGGGQSGHGGDLLYRWGNPQVYDAGGANDQQLFGQHNAQWIDDGLSGAGDILVFNNGQGRTGGNYSSVEEIVAPLAGYNYTLAAGAAWGPAAATWSYTAATPTDFYADHISGAQRLANGDTLVCDGPAGEFFEVTTGGETVWDYVNPFTGTTAQGESAETFRATVSRWMPRRSLRWG